MYRHVRPFHALIITAMLLTMIPLGIIPAGVAQAATPAFLANPLLNPFGNTTASIATGDLNGDGALDLVMGNNGQASLLYINDGLGNYTPSPIQLNPAGNSTVSVVLGDLDGNSSLDIVLGNADQPSLVYLNTGAGTFSPPTQIDPAGTQTRDLALGDLDGNGTLDIVLVDGGGAFNDDEYAFISDQSQIYLNNGAGVFTPGALLPPIYGVPASTAIGDLNGDTLLDIVLTGDEFTIGYGQVQEGSSYVFFNNGEDGFAANPDTYYAMASSVALGDLNGDGALDMLLGNTGYIVPTYDPPTQIVPGTNSVYLNDGAGAFSSIQLNTGDSTYAVALGDLSGDGVLDIVLGNYGNTGSKVFVNNATGATTPTFTLNAAPINPGGNNTLDLALADVNGDRGLDVVLGNNGQPSRAYLNTTANGFNLKGVLQNDTTGRDYSVLTGDLNGDGALDGIFSDFDRATAYLNDGTGNLAPSATPITAPNVGAYTGALGDLNGDGTLDVVLGGDEFGYNRPMRVYLNNGAATFTPAAATVNGAGSRTRSAALGDLDSDGDLDLVLGNYTPASQVYLNDGAGNFTPIATPLNPAGNDTNSVALGDLDGDGSLDIVLGNGSGQPSQIYFNNGTASFRLATAPINPAGSNTQSVAVADLNGDQALDIVLGNEGESQVYLNDRFGKFVKAPVPLDPGGSLTSVVKIADLNDDGALDILLGVNAYPFNEPSQVYLNNGSGSFSPALLPATAARNFMEDLGLADFNGDGALDIVLGSTSNRGPELYLRVLPIATPTRNMAPSVRITRPGTTANADYYSTPQILEERYITIPFKLVDRESDPVRQVVVQYSLDGGSSWRIAQPRTPADTLNLATSPAGTTHNFVWDTYVDGNANVAVFGQSDNVVVRLLAIPNPRRGTKQAADFQQFGAAKSISVPFRVRGAVARVVSPARPNGEAGAFIYKLPAGQVRDAERILHRLTGQPLTTSPQGYLNSRDPLQPNDRLAAVLPITRTTKYDLYYTSPIDRDTGLPSYTVTQPGVQVLTVSPTNPLILFKLAVTLEWDARNDLAFMNQLRQDLLRTSELLYDWSDGQAALGTTTIYHNKERWEDAFDTQGRVITPAADIQIYATNRLRPNATQGGITLQTVTDPAVGTITYEPGQVRMGATWTRNGDPGGTLGEDWPRTLAHELGHYALYLEDNYLGLDTNGRLTSVSTCRGAMGDPYREDYSEFHPAGAEWDATCAQTLSERLTGRSDWETINAFYTRTQAEDGINFQLNLPTNFNALPGPIVQALNFTTLSEIAPASANTARTILLNLTDPSGQRYLASSGARAVRYSADGQRAIDLGVPSSDQLLVRGAVIGDQVCVTDNPRNYVGCTTISAIGTQLVLSNRADWQPDLQITPVTSTTVNLAVPAAGVGNPAPPTINATLFPEGAAPISFTLTLNGANYTGTTGQLPSPVLGGVMRIAVPGEANSRTALADYSLGGDPAPRQRPKRKNKKRAPALSADGQAILFTDNLTVLPGQFYAFQSVDRLPQTPPWTVPVGLGYRLLASDDALRGQINRAALGLSYFAADVPFNTEDGLQIYYLAPGATNWQALDTRLDPDENSASAVPPGEGLYALLASVPLVLEESGWNLIYSYPGATQALPEALGGGIGRYSLVYSYNDADENDPWKAYSPELPAQWAGLVNDLTILENGNSYWFRSSQPVTIPVRPLTGNSALAQSLAAPPATYYGIVPITTTNVLTIEAQIGASECGRTTTQRRTIDGVEQIVYSLNVLANGAGDAAGCGQEGLPVTLRISDNSGVLRNVITSWENNGLIRLDLYESNAQPTGLALDRAGWNLVPNYPFASEVVTNGLSLIDGGPTLVYNFNPYRRDEPWQIYAGRQQGVPTWVSNLDTLSNQENYFIYATAPITPVVPPTLRPADLGEPPAGFPETPPATYYATLQGVNIADQIEATATISETSCGTARVVALTGNSVGLVFHVEADSELAGCGTAAPASLVTFSVSVNDEPFGTAALPWDNSSVQPVGFYKLYLPMQLVNTTTGPSENQVDLEIVAVNVIPANPTEGEPAEVQVTIRNNGAANLNRSFWVDLYLDPETAPEGGIGWPEVSEFGASWRVYGIQAGQTIVLSTLSPNDPLNPGQNYSNFSGFPFEGQSILYAQVDAYGEEGDPEGAIAETNEDNNIAGPITIVVAPPPPDTIHGTRS
jgi:hypothetical protein